MYSLSVEFDDRYYNTNFHEDLEELLGKNYSGSGIGFGGADASASYSRKEYAKKKIPLVRKLAKSYNLKVTCRIIKD